MTYPPKPLFRRAIWLISITGFLVFFTIWMLVGCLKAPVIDTHVDVATRPQTASTDNRASGDGNIITTVNIQLGAAYLGCACLGFAAWKGVRYRQSTDRMIGYIEDWGPDVKAHMKLHHDAVNATVHKRVKKLT